MKDSSVHLHNAVNLPNKDEAGHKADKTSEKEKENNHNEGITKVKESAGSPSDGQLGTEEMD